MARIVVSDREKGKAYQIEPEESKFERLLGLKIGEKFEGDIIGLPGFELKITGGSDEEGFPMRSDVMGEGRTQALFSGGSGYNPTQKGERQRKTVRGNKISKNILQLNVIVEKHGENPIEQALGLETSEEELEKEVEEEKEEAEEKTPEEETSEEETSKEEPPEKQEKEKDEEKPEEEKTEKETSEEEPKNSQKEKDETE